MTREQAIELAIGTVCSPGGIVRIAEGETASEVTDRIRGSAIRQVDTLVALGLLKLDDGPLAFLNEGMRELITTQLHATGYKIVKA